MKKIIYLQLIAFIGLTGCKGKSFMTQRYTNFAHNVEDRSKQKKPSAVNETCLPSRQETSLPSNKEIMKIQGNANVLVCSVSPKEMEVANQPGSPIYKVKARIENGLSYRNYVNELWIKKESTNNGVKKTAKQRIEVAKGLIGGALNLLISIIVLIVVVALVIILVTAIL